MNKSEFKDLMLYANSRGYKTVQAAVENYKAESKSVPMIFYEFIENILGRDVKLAISADRLMTISKNMPGACLDLYKCKLAVFVPMNEYISSMMLNWYMNPEGITIDELRHVYSVTDNRFGYYAHRWVEQCKNLLNLSVDKYHQMIDQVVAEYHNKGDKEDY